MEYLGRIEWEILQDTISFDCDIPEQLPSGGYARCNVFRDAEYKIVAELEILGVDHQDVERQREEKRTIVAGTSVPTFALSGTEITHSYMMPEVCEGSSSLTFNSTSSLASYKVELLVVAGLEMNIDLHYELGWVSEWYINGPRHSFIFTSGSDRKYRQTFERELRSLKGITYPNSFKGTSSSSGTTFDHSLIETGEISFVIGAVPIPYGPSWSRSLYISYFPQFGPIPDKQTREAISEIAGFILGRHLLYVGFSVFDQLGQPMQQDAISPWADNIRATCATPDFSPIYKGQYDEFGQVDDALCSLTGEYLRLRDTLSLKDALWRYWIANATPLGTNLPILSSGLEGLMRAWFKSTKSKSHGEYIKHKDYQALIAEGIEKISEALVDVPAREILLRKISGTNRMGVNEQFSVFFEEIGLLIGEVERVAIKERNVMAHGNLDGDDGHYVAVVTRAYQTLFHRVILRLLGYSGQYVDYSTYDFPKRELQEPLGGPFGDGQLKREQFQVRHH